jgi:ubiquitin carboxyl-terminal hydrolase 4/11
VISRFAPQFAGYNQQDSMELMGYLFDGLHEDLNLVKQKPLTKDPSGMNKMSDKEIADIFWANYRKRNQSIIIDTIVGQYKSSVDCPDCPKIGKSFEMFFILSIPIPMKEMCKLKIYFLTRDTWNIPSQMTFRLPKETPIRKIKELIGEYQKIPDLQSRLLTVRDQQIEKEYRDDMTCGELS